MITYVTGTDFLSSFNTKSTNAIWMRLVFNTKHEIKTIDKCGVLQRKVLVNYDLIAKHWREILLLSTIDDAQSLLLGEELH